MIERQQLVDWCQTLETAMEHGSAGFGAMERESKIQWIQPKTWPPKVMNPVGSDVYHFAAMAMYVQRIYEAIRQLVPDYDELCNG